MTVVLVSVITVTVIAAVIIFIICYKLHQTGRPLCPCVIKVFCKEKSRTGDENPVIVDNINDDDRNPPRAVIPTRIDSNGMETDRHIPRVSEVLYVELCRLIGTPTQVKIRRDVMDTMDMVDESVKVYCGARKMVTGSYREGFRLKTSDRDFMYWFTDVIVINDPSQIPPYHQTQTLIKMECEDTPPGSAKLQLLTPTNIPYISQSCVSLNDQVYISSSFFRGECLKKTESFPQYGPSTHHGPCASGFYMGNLEYDLAFCFSCKQWPYPAYQWIERCQRQRWPSPHVLQDIISDECHLVPIGSGGSTSPQQCEIEWRISFSRAECKLVSSMNHTQFLCYALLKIFLKEVLNDGLENPLLCSYFIKTTLFWKIQENTISVWCSKNILYCVWVCFKYLTQCVYRGELPNFFIPQNNLFRNKIHGTAQKQLFLKLHALYNMGLTCLLLSQSLDKILKNAILNPRLQVCSDENNIISEIELDQEFVKEICENGAVSCVEPLYRTLVYLKINDNLYKTISTSSENHIATLHLMRNFLLVRYAFCLDKSNGDNNVDKTDNCTPLDILKSATESGFISNTLYVGMYLYNKGRYAEALYLLGKTKKRLRRPYILDITTASVNVDRYMDAVGGNSLIDKISKAVSFEIEIDEICCIDELRLEVRVCKQNGGNFISVQAMVMTHMLTFLCHHNLGDRRKSKKSLGNLHTLLHYDEEQYINSSFRDISWQVLGICEEIYGDKEKALHSYQTSNMQEPHHKINDASWTRIHEILSQNKRKCPTIFYW